MTLRITTWQPLAFGAVVAVSIGCVWFDAGDSASAHRLTTQECKLISGGQPPLACTKYAYSVSCMVIYTANVCPLFDTTGLCNVPDGDNTCYQCNKAYGTTQRCDNPLASQTPNATFDCAAEPAAPDGCGLLYVGTCDPVAMYGGVTLCLCDSENTEIDCESYTVPEDYLTPCSPPLSS